MRNPERIDPLLEKLGDAWHKHPDWRFGQFMMNFFSLCQTDPFHLEDDVWMIALQAFIDGKNPKDAIDDFMEKQHG